eukprot:g10159.t1
MISNTMVKPGQTPLFDSPANHGIDYEDVEFPPTDGTTLRGWLIKSGNDKVIIQSHFGVQCNRSGYLMFDLRGHGSSDVGPNPWVSWGPEEAKDVIGAVNFVERRKDLAGASIGLLSICMGAGSTTYAYGLEDGLAGHDRIKAFVAVQPLLYDDFMNALGVPGFMRRAADCVTTERLGFDLASPNFVDSAPKVNVPTLVIQNENDPWTRMGMVQDYYDALNVEKDLKLLDEERSRFAAYDWWKAEGNYVLWSIIASGEFEAMFIDE